MRVPCKLSESGKKHSLHMYKSRIKVQRHRGTCIYGRRSSLSRLDGEGDRGTAGLTINLLNKQLGHTWI